MWCCCVTFTTKFETWAKYRAKGENLFLNAWEIIKYRSVYFGVNRNFK